VEVAAYVTDRSGALVRDLQPHELEVLEDGKAQPLAAFSLVDIPVIRDEPRGVSAAVSEPGYVSNARQAEGRAFVILLDPLHVAAVRSLKARQVMREFVTEHMADNDLAAVVHVGRPRYNVDFTSDKQRLLTAVDGFIGEKMKPRTLVKWEQLSKSKYPEDNMASERASRVRQSLMSLREVIGYLQGLHGRRTSVLFVSEGTDMDLNDMIGTRFRKQLQASSFDIDGAFDNTDMEAAYASMIFDEIQLTMQAASRTNVAVYTVDPRALGDPNEEMIGVTGTLGNVASDSALAKLLPTMSLRQEYFSSLQFLRSIAEQTGGTPIVNTNNFSDAFAQLVQDSSAYYLLGYRAPGRPDGKFRRITVRSTRPGTSVRARKGYHAARTSPAAAPSRGVLGDLLSSPVPVPGLTMRAASTVLPMDAAGGTVRFVVEIDPAGLRLVDQDGRSAGSIELAYAVVDEEGAIEAHATKTITLSLTESTRTALQARGLRYAADVSLPAGRHHVRVAAREANGQVAGSIFWQVDVPDYSRRPLSMSPIVLASSRADQVPTVSDAAAAPAIVPGLLTATRAFERDDTLSIGTVIHEREAAPDGVRVNLVITADDGSEVYRTSGLQPGRDTRGASTSVYFAQVPLADLSPGRFVLTVEGSAGSRRPVRQQLVFDVR
jgi:VWFA-related protein